MKIKRRNFTRISSLSVPLRVGMVFLIGTVILMLRTGYSNYNKVKNDAIKTEDKERCTILSRLSPEELSKIEEIDLGSCNLKSLSKNIRYATNMKKLDIGFNKDLTTLPEELKECTSLEILFASSCISITSLPPVLGKMTSMTRLGWKSGSLTSIEAENLPPNLLHLILTDNQIEFIDDPKLFSTLRQVKKLMLSHNKIKSFGGKGGLNQMQSLELIRLAGNELTSLPSEIWELPSLTWMAISGNPITNDLQKPYESNLPLVTMNDLKPLDKYLGQGASGKVSLYQWGSKEVALKLIHGVTSDGKAEDELSIYNAVGSDATENRVAGAIALLNEDDKKGVVMEPLPENLVDFADPPTIVEIIADRWDRWKGESFTAEFVTNALKDSVSALLFLHDFGVSHGDFYAHNIKVNEETGRLFLLDFGASFFKGSYAVQAEKLEVRAFGIFVAELMTFLDPSENKLLEDLEDLRDRCIDTSVDERPLFKEIQIIIDEF